MSLKTKLQIVSQHVWKQIKIINDACEIAELFVILFTSATNFQNLSPFITWLSRRPNILLKSVIHENRIGICYIRLVKVYASSPNGYRIGFLKNAPPIVCDDLLSIFDIVWNRDDFPSSWKKVMFYNFLEQKKFGFCRQLSLHFADSITRKSI